MMDQTNVGNMNGYYNRQFSTDDLESYASMGGQDTAMAMMGAHGMDSMGGMGAHPNHTVAQMMSDQHQKDLSRRRSFHHSIPYNPNPSLQDHDSRRSSMLEFGSRGNIDIDTFQFDPTPQPPPTSAQSHNNNAQRQTGNLARRRLDSQRARRQHSNEDLALNTSFSNMPPTYSPIPGSGSYQGLSASDPMGFDISSNYMNMMGMDFGGMDSSSASGITPRTNYVNNYTSDLHASPMVQHNLSSQMGGQMHDPGGGMVTNNVSSQGMMGGQALNMPDQTQNIQTNLSQTSAPMQNPEMTVQTSDNGRNAAKPPPVTNLDVRSDADNITFQDPNNTAQQVIPQYRNAYSSSGFDMLGVLMRVAARPKPQINIGAVDMSCAFVVCDVTKHDLPIVYCSEVFERLTAYTKHEILGRNCRFLQAPDGRIKAGVKRKYVDDQSVLRIKKMIAQRQETQVSLINYRKGGQPFMNLLTMIPITWDTDEVKYYVGFQVDLVEQPSSVTNKNSDGSYAVSYQRGSTLPPYIMPDSHNRHGSELSQTVHRDDVSTVLSTIGSGESELSKRIWDKVLLENTDDVVHVLSLKGLFLYLSPSSRKVLEYDPAELVGTALSSVCHPSDIVPVTRELKDTATGAAVNVVFRVRRKLSGYTWFESHGSLHLEQGKGRKCIIMVGRERPVYALARNEVDAVGGIGESELWSKMSTSGMFLYVSANVRSLLDRQPEDLVGTSAQALMRQESRLEFGKKLEVARTGIKASFKHDIQNKRGQTLQAQTTIYPGDASEGQKPTFLVAQTRLLKSSRNTKRHNSNVSGKADQIDDGGSGASSAASALSGQTPTSAPPTNYGEGITTQAGGSGLTIGNQHEALASEDNVFDELKTTRSTSWQFELRQMEKRNRLLAEELQSLLSSKKKRKRRNGAGNLQKDCVNCHTRVTPEWRRGPSGNRDLCNSCGLRWAKENGRVTPRTSSQHSDKSASPRHPTSLTAMSALEQHAPNNTPPQEKKQSPQTVNTNSHINKVARMEATASEGFGGGIPPKIDEGIEYPAPKPTKI